MLWPREHGAYGQLGAPLVAALAVTRPGAAAWAIAAAAVLLFLAHEPLLVVLGQRGPRALREHGARARRALVACLVGAGVLGAVALLLMPPGAAWSLFVPVFLTLALAPRIAAGEEHTLSGELQAATAMSSVALPVVLAGGGTTGAGLLIWLVFAVIFAVGTLAVHAVVCAVRTTFGLRRLAAVLAAALVPVVAVLLPGHLAPFTIFAAVLPVCALSLVLALRPPHPRNLRKVGWTLVAATLVSTAVLIVGLRAEGDVVRGVHDGVPARPGSIALPSDAADSLARLSLPF
jgi:hypothetical protein